jgi:hypothetical protein
MCIPFSFKILSDNLNMSVYMCVLGRYTFSYNSVSALDILLHLRTIYSIIDPMELAENYNHMAAPYDMPDPMETLFTQIDDGVRYANSGGQPHHDAQYANIAFLVVLSTGVIPGACYDWQCRTVQNQTWAQFNPFFANAYRKHCLI